MANRRVDGLSFKAGPTESGRGPSDAVGGEMVDINVVAVFLSRYWLLILILLIPLAVVLYKKRSVIPKWFLQLMYKFKGL